MLYHFSPVFDSALLGIKLCTFNESYYWKSKLVKDLNADPEVTTGNKELDEAIKKVFVHGKYAMELLKEYVFEEIRQQEFSSKPSRRRCMYAFAFNDPDAYAKRLNFPRHKYRLFRVSPVKEALIHYGDMNCLDVNLGDHKAYCEAARNYWRGSDPESLNTEVLIEGEFVLTEVVGNLPNAGR